MKERGGERERESVCVWCVCVCVCVCACVRACVARARAFVLYASNFENMCLQRTCKRLGPVRVKRCKYPLLLLQR